MKKTCFRMNKEFRRADRQTYTNEEKLELGELVYRFKEEYDAEFRLNEGKTRFDAKRKRHIPIKPTSGNIAKAVRHLYSDLADARNDDPQFNKAMKLASCAYRDLDSLRDPSSCPPKKARAAGAGRKLKSPEVILMVFKGHLPRH